MLGSFFQASIHPGGTPVTRVSRLRTQGLLSGIQKECVRINRILDWLVYYEVNVLIVLTDVDVTVTTSKTVRQSLDEDAPGDEFGVMEQSHTILLCSLSHAVNTWHSSTTPTAKVFSWPKPNPLQIEEPRQKSLRRMLCDSCVTSTKNNDR